MYFLRRITYKWNKCIFILFLFGPLGIRVAAQVETDDSFLPIGVWAGINGTKKLPPTIQKKPFLVPDCLSWWNWWEDRWIYFSSARLFYVFHAGSSCKCILCPSSISVLFYAPSVPTLDSNVWSNLLTNFLWMSMGWPVQILWIVFCCESKSGL